MAKNDKKKNKKVVAKTVEPKVKKEKASKVKPVKAKKVVVKEKKIKKGKLKAFGNKIKALCSSLVNTLKSNIPFAISLGAILLLIIALVLVLCIKRVPKTKNGDEILATVKGKTVTAEELYTSLKESYGADALMNVIDTYIANKEVKVTKEHKEYVKEVVEYYKSYAEYYQTDLLTFLNSYVGLNVESEEQFEEYVLADYKKSLAVQKFIGDNAKEKDLKEYYKNNYSDKITLRHILIEVDSEAEDADAADKEAYDKAVSIINKLNDIEDKDKVESKFSEYAKKNSDDTATYNDGGLIEDVVKTQVEESFYNAASKLKNGKYTTEPVKTSYGYHIIYRISSTPVEKYKDIKEDVKASYAQSLMSEDSSLLTTKWAELRKQYKLSIKDDVLKEIYEASIK